MSVTVSAFRPFTPVLAAHLFCPGDTPQEQRRIVYREAGESRPVRVTTARRARRRGGRLAVPSRGDRDAPTHGRSPSPPSFAARSTTPGPCGPGAAPRSPAAPASPARPSTAGCAATGPATRRRSGWSPSARASASTRRPPSPPWAGTGRAAPRRPHATADGPGRRGAAAPPGGPERVGRGEVPHPGNHSLPRISSDASDRCAKRGRQAERRPVPQMAKER